MEVWCLLVDHESRPVAGQPIKVQVSSETDVDDLKEKVKDKVSPRLDDTAAFELEVWRFTNSPANFVDYDHEVLKELVSKAFSNRGVKKLRPRQVIEHLINPDRNAVSDGEPLSNGEALLVKLPGRKPQTEDDMPQLDPPILELYCLIRGSDANNIFPVEIASSKCVGALKKAIKEGRTPIIDHVPADALTLWMVSIAVDNNFDEAMKTVELEDAGSLSPVDILSEIFLHPPQRRHLHIVVQVPRIVSYGFVGSAQLLVYKINRSELAVAAFSKWLGTPSTRHVFPYKGRLVSQARKEYCEAFSQKAPSSKGVHDTFAANQKKTPPAFAFSRPPIADVTALLEVKQELSTGGADPLFEAAWYYNALTWDHSVDKTHSCLPCFILYLAGTHIGFAGALWTVYPHVQVLAPTLPLFYHASDVNMHMQTARFLGATRKAIFALNHYYKSELPQITVDPTVNFPYPTDFISLDSGENCAFEYLSWLDHKRLLFSGTAGDKKIFIKFTHRYSKDAHLKCVALKCAPALEGFQDIPGGWHMVVMGLIGDDYHELRCSDMKASFKSEIERKVTDLHQNEFVHGDIRTTNIMVRKDGKPGILLVDFDWAGKIGEVRYPMNVNDVEIKRPEGASDDQLIKAEHDIAMIGYMFE
ncbi:uncharacterized protein EI90DRAFT_3129111 [Cantharellus anzutake]|uniref:uncharacterized protein n=1 Tax=Cantharellus anzutake TaxID=1750568 RepID=UPI0019068358|nr:uncharacterized protein EI90DRAFT_3129111 [Cantharellus anzutake]KAF8325050.1 hypothetical protein EI90DRAFT_3129111 [Cantharellus anzutake]